MTLASALAAGAIVGARHALESDHLAAVATIVEEDESRPGLVGASWGVGHSLPVVLLGLTFVWLGVRLPGAFTVLFEAVVGAVLVFLGARMLWRVLRDRPATGHDHRDGTGSHEDADGTSPADRGDGTRHRDGAGGTGHTHIRFGGLSLGLTHGHLDGEGVAVGVLHGLAGSGALVVLLVSSAPTAAAAASFLASFALLSVVTMALVVAVWGRTLGTRFERVLEVTAGVVGVAVGALLLAEQVGLAGVL
ncbi:high-affinity nickel-transporter protein [Halorarum salinum]|uniref:High-affinity nickel-transporter protein n=1 Tax=Halorarum salinum TaxID=2743089 RepID=A0A7D5QA97_9EURY|nr:high-affinity nickel-transporter protein [Halobaculum salinum]QLG61598.1 high-affinity nickel-transporter protein [Halobaculum salinum]